MANLSGKKLSRRELLFRTRTTDSAELEGCSSHLPWANEDDIARNCTGCGACQTACPENIIILSQNNKASVDFSKGECVFCEACAESCPEPVFWDASQRAKAAPWSGFAVVEDTCLAKQGVTCQICKDQCPEFAISFPPVIGGAGAPVVETTDCTACGACLAPCPVEAIRIDWNPQNETARFLSEKEGVG